MAAAGQLSGVPRPSQNWMDSDFSVNQFLPWGGGGEGNVCRGWAEDEAIELEELTQWEEMRSSRKCMNSLPDNTHSWKQFFFMIPGGFDPMIWGHLRIHYGLPRWC